MQYAWIENERIRDICRGGNPAECYTENVAAYYSTLVPDEANPGDSYVNGQWTPAPPLNQGLTETNNSLSEAPGAAPNVIE